jgi:hypothetical protein
MTAPMPWATSKGADQVKEEGIVGRWFVTAAEDGMLHNQGRVNEMISDAGYYMVVAFSWLTGRPTGEYIVSFDDIARHFVFTGRTAEEHDEFCERNSRGRGRKIGKPAFDLARGAKAP